MSDNKPTAVMTNEELEALRQAYLVVLEPDDDDQPAAPFLYETADDVGRLIDEIMRLREREGKYLVTVNLDPEITDQIEVVRSEVARLDAALAAMPLDEIRNCADAADMDGAGDTGRIVLDWLATLEPREMQP